MGDGWGARLLQVFGPLLAAWSAFLAFLVHLKKIRNSEKAAAHSRIIAELEQVYEALKVSREECDLLRDKLAGIEANRIEWMGRAVKAERTLDGIGEARQEAQRIISEERQKDAEKRLGGNGQ